MKNSKIIVLLILLYSGCQENKDQTAGKESISTPKNSITIIFDQRDYSSDTLRFTSGAYATNENTLWYAQKGQSLTQSLTPNNQEIADTIVIDTENEIIVTHLYNYYFNSTHNFIPGDTALFTYQKGIPYVKILNRKVPGEILNFEVNYDRDVPRPVSRNEFYLKNKRFRTDLEFKAYNDNRNEINLQKMALLDSLLGIHSFPSLVSTFNNNKFRLPAIYFDDFDNQLVHDSLLSVKSYSNFLVNYTYFKFKVDQIQRGRQEGILNYKQAYDSIEKNKSLFGKRVYNFLLHDNLKGIAENFPDGDFKSYYERFKRTNTEKMLISDINENYILNFDGLKSKTDNVYLIDLNKKKITLNELLSKYEGKVVYIDFWASWCAPCRKAMPASKLLREQFNNQDIIFLYISIDKNFQNWNIASFQEGIKLYGHTFLAVNYPKADFFKEMNLASIPRYMIVNKAGEFSFNDAPSPDSDNIFEYLRGYLKNSEK